MKQNKDISLIGLMNNKELKESIEEIFTDHYFASTQSRNDKRREKIKTYINKVREEAVIGFVKYMQGEGFKDDVTREDFARYYLQSNKEKND